MKTVVPSSAAEAVANGAQLLDEKYPGWWRQIDLELLDISFHRNCVCGQLARTHVATHEAFGFAWFAYEILNIHNDHLGVYGFVNYLPSGWFTSYEELTVEWTRAISARLDADALSEKIKLDRKEPALA